MYILAKISRNPLWPLAALWRRGSKYIKNDELYLRVQYFLEMKGKVLHLDNPCTFTEKIQWLKINAYKPEYSKMVDKAAVKEYVRGIIGDEYIIPTIGVWDSVSDIDWDLLPKQFVIKTTHGGGGLSVVICRDKTTFDKKAAIAKLNKWMPFNAGYTYREKPYIFATAGIIAEKLMVNHYSNGNAIDGDLTDYKFYCFNGEPVYCQVIRDRNNGETIDFYDMDWNLMPFVGLNPNVTNGESLVERPLHLGLMKEIARKLSRDIPFTRIDLYVIDDKVYFGEITFYPNGGVGRFTPKEWDKKLGELLTLPNIKINESTTCNS